MKPVILLYSFTGNNRLLAQALARRLSCAVVEVTPRRRRFAISIAIDLMFKRFPRINAIDLPEHDHVLVMAPLWNRWIAHPMRSALKMLGAGLVPYSVLTFSGGFRTGQIEFVDEQLMELIGQKPVHHWTLYVDRLVPDDIKGTPKASSFKVTSDEVEAYPELDDIVAGLGG